MQTKTARIVASGQIEGRHVLDATTRRYVILCSISLHYDLLVSTGSNASHRSFVVLGVEHHATDATSNKLPASSPLRMAAVGPGATE